uniref:Phosphoserine phosphatase n=2 Tax=Clytia hemisphaerica TaxID=252671 RepID=A0A7M5TRJ7_9CNID
ELVSKLNERKKDVYLVSGGFRSFIAPVAKELNIPLDNLFTNIFIFNDDGSYGGFDKDQPTSSSGGKKVVATKLKTEKGYKSLVMIGDGVTDLEAYPPADLFIGFGGNKIRENVRQNSPWFVTQFQELIDVL